MSLSEKFGIPASLLDAAKKTLAESEAYQQKVKAHMAKKGVKSLSDMTADQKKKFFNELDAMHTAKNEEVELEESSMSNQWKSGAKSVKKGSVELVRGKGVHTIKKDGKEIGDFSLDDDAGNWVVNWNKKKPGRGQGVHDQIDDIIDAALKEEFESVEEELKGDMHPGAKKVLKHIKPEHHDKYKPYLKKGTYKGDYKDRAAVLSAAERAKHTNEEYFAEEEELEELAISPAARRDAHERERDYHSRNRETDVSPSADLNKHKLKTLRHAHELHSMHQGTADTSNKDEKSDFHNATKTMRRIEKHVAAKHGKKEAARLQRGDYREEVSLEDISLEDIESFMQTEDYNQLDELSKNTLASYIKKRSNDVATMGAVTRKYAMDSDAKKKEHGAYTNAARELDQKSNKAFMKGWKHRQNIGKAVDKLTKEELEFIESLNAGTAKE